MEGRVKVQVESLAVAVLLAVLPLLPAAAGLLGINPVDAFDAAIVALLIIWAAVRLRAWKGGHDRSTAGSSVLRAWALFVAVATGAMLVGLAAENRWGSAVFLAHAPESLSQLLRPLDSRTDAFNSFRVWLTFLEGFVVFAALRSCFGYASDRHAFVRVACWGWLAGLAVVSVLAIVQYLTGLYLHPLWIQRNPMLVRANSTLDDPNMLASYLLLGVGLAIGVGRAERGRGAAIAAAIASSGCLALLTTVSRIGWAALVLTGLLLIGFGPARRFAAAGIPLTSLQSPARRLLWAIALLAVVLAAARVAVEQRPVEAPDDPVEAVLQTLDPRTPLDTVFKDRLVYWAAALRIAGEHPATGIGLGRYPRQAPDLFSRWVPLDNAHNFFLQLLAETGVIGLSAFIALLMMAIAALWRAAEQPDVPGASLALGALFGTVAFAMTLTTGHPLNLQSGQILWSSSLALGFGAASLNALGAPALRRRRTWFRGAAVVIMCTYIAAAWRMPPPPQRDATWGYSWGLFPEEWGFLPEAWGLPFEPLATATGPAGTAGARFRWSGPQALLEMQVPDGAHDCVLAFAALLPSRFKIGQSIQLSYGGTEQTIHATTSDLQSVRIPLTADMLDAERRLLVRILVVPPFVPADLGMSDDARKLGVQLFRPRCD